MGLLDALLGNDQGGGLLGGLPSSWQYQNPADKKNSTDDFLAALSNSPYAGIGGAQAPAPNLFGPVPNFQQQPPNVFAAGAPGIAGTGPMGIDPSMFAPQQPRQPAPQVVPPQAAQPPAPQNDPINNMQIGGYQMPQFGSATDYTPTTTPANAQPAQGQLPQAAPQQQQLPPALGGNQSGGNIGAGLNNFANAGGLLPAIAGGITGLMTGQRTDAAGMQQQNLKAQYEATQGALIQAGRTPQEASSLAMLAVMNPEAAKTLLPEALSTKADWGVVREDAQGNKEYGWINKYQQTINGREMGAEGSPTGSAASSFGFLAPGVKQIDSTLKGKDYLSQFSPEVQAGVQNYIDGKSMPTGNPRKGFTQTVKMIAQKVGEDTGQSVDDTTYAARRTMRNQLSSSAPASLGGQINIGNTAAGHLADLSQKALELGNVDTGIAPLSAAVNSVRGLGTEQAAKMEALKGAAQHYGQEITKFYAGSPGGTAERDRFIESVNGARSPKELAAILSTEGELMRSRLDALGGQIKGVLGEEGAQQYPVLRPDGQAALAKVEENVSKLKGGQAASNSTKTGVTWSIVK